MNLIAVQPAYLQTVISDHPDHIEEVAAASKWAVEQTDRFLRRRKCSRIPHYLVELAVVIETHLWSRDFRETTTQFGIRRQVPQQTIADTMLRNRAQTLFDALESITYLI